MEKERISSGQLFALIFLFEMGTALVVVQISVLGADRYGRAPFLCCQRSAK